MRDFKKSSSFGKRTFAGPPSFGARRGSSTFAKRSFDKPLEMHQAECNKCHKMCEVPFRPNGKKPVYCRDCFKDAERTTSYDRAEEPRGEEHGASDLKKQFNVLNTKLDRLIAVIEAQTQALSRDR